MRPALCLVFASLLAMPAAAQMTIQRPLNANIAQKIHVQSPGSVFLGETPEMCAARNKFLHDRVIPALQAQMAQLQSEIADRRAHSYTCSPDYRVSVSGSGMSTDCGIYVCNPVDGLCRSWAKTSDDCAPGYLWNGFRSCVPAR